MNNIFCENIVVDEQKRVKGIFDLGLNKSRTIRGTELKDIRPFLILTEVFKKGSKAIIRGKTFRIAEVEESSTGLNTHFLEVWNDTGSDYLNQG